MVCSSIKQMLNIGVEREAQQGAVSRSLCGRMLLEGAGWLKDKN